MLTSEKAQLLENLPKIMKNRKKIRFFFRNKFFGVKNSKFANLPKRALPKFRADWSQIQAETSHLLLRAIYWMPPLAAGSR